MNCPQQTLLGETWADERCHHIFIPYLEHRTWGAWVVSSRISIALFTYSMLVIILFLLYRSVIPSKSRAAIYFAID